MKLTAYCCALVLIAAASGPQAQVAPSRAELEMAAKSPAFRAAAERFVAAAVAADAAAVEAMLSPAIVARAGKATLDKVIGGQILPFFAGQKELGRSVTITHTTDASGNAGFAYYMYSVAPSGEQKPFVVYVVEEDGRKVVANILVNHFVKGRHQ